MDAWKNIQSSIASLNIGENAKGIAKGFGSTVQATKERFGTVTADEITELPQEYKDLEARVDALRETHQAMIKITGVFATPYDYPTQITEQLSSIGSTVSTGFSSVASTIQAQTGSTAASAAAPTTPAPKPILHKTLPHALSRAALSSAKLAPGEGSADPLSHALQLYGDAMAKTGEARLNQDDQILAGFYGPWSKTLTTGIAVAMKARAAVKASRLELDGTKQSLKNASPARQEQLRIDVENCEDDLVQKTEVAISLMKAVLDNPEPIRNLHELVKAQLTFHAAAADALAAAQGEIEELSVQAEASYRKSRDH